MSGANVEAALPDLGAMLAVRPLKLRTFRLALVEKLKTVAPLDQLEFSDKLIEQVLQLGHDVASRQHRDAAFLVLKFQKRWSEFEILLERMPMPVDLGPTARLAVVQAREKMGHFDDALAYAQDSVELFPGSRALHRRLYKLLRVTDRASEADELFARMRTNFEVQDVVSAISGLKGVELPTGEIDFLIGQLQVTDEAQLPKLSLTLASAALSTDQLATLTAMLESLDTETATRLRIVLATSEDEADLARLHAEPISLHQFERRRDAIRRDEHVLSQFGPDGSHPLTQQVRSIAEASRTAAISTRESYFDSLTLALELQSRISSQTPTLFTRVGDGEGAFMRGHQSNPSALDGSESAARETIWWGERTTSVRAADFAENYRSALGSADIVGLPPLWRVRQPFSGAAGREMRQNLAQSLKLVEDHAPIGSSFITSAHANTDLERWNLWRLVLNATDSVSFVSCHDLEGPLDQQFSITTDTKILVPGVHRFAEVFGDVHGLGPSSLLDHHDQVCDTIRSKPNGVWLIAAGFLGKHYAALARRGGGVAIDIGALADYWAGYGTRAFTGDPALHHLPASLATDVNVSWRNKPAPTTEPGERVRSNFYFDGFSRRTDNHRDQSEGGTPQPLRFKIIGHPRCASGYVSKVFEGIGFSVGHERLRADGIASWMLTADDEHVPWGDVPPEDQTFAHVLGYVRDPFEAIPSIMLENQAHDSFMYRRLHILRVFDLDIGDFKTALDRAAASLVYWDLLASPQLTGPTIHIERAEAEIRSFLHDVGLAPAEASLPDEPGMRYNSSVQKHGIDTKPLPQAVFSALDSSLRSLLEEYCARYEYDLPAQNIDS